MREVSQSGELGHLAAERVWIETEKALGEPNPEQYFTTLNECQALATWWPELAEGETLTAALAEIPSAPEESALPLAHWRYALLVSLLSDEQRDALASRLRLPNSVAQLARHTALTKALLNEPLNGERVLHWLERLDGWRKPAQVAAQLALVSRLAPERQAVLRAAWQAAQAVSPQALLSEGYRGAALGEALRQHRQKAVAGALGEG